MHNSHQSFASRQRMLDHDGRASNQVIWFSRARRRPHARGVPRDGRVAARAAAGRPTRPTAASRRPAPRSRAAHASWDGILNSRPDGACTTAFPLHSTSRIVAGGPLRGGVYKCALQPVVEGDRARALRLVEADRGRAGAARADLPDRGLRLHEAETSVALGEVTDRSQQPFRVGLVVVVDEAGADGAVRLEAEVALELARVVVALPDGDLRARRARRRPRRRCGRAR